MKHHNDTINIIENSMGFVPRSEEIYTKSADRILSHKAVYADSDCIGIVGTDHDLTAPSEHLEQFQSLAGEFGSGIGKITTWNGRGDYLAEAKLNEYSFESKKPGDVTEVSLRFRGSILGHSRQTVSFSLYRIWCSNGLGNWEVKCSAIAKRSKNFTTNWDVRFGQFRNEFSASVMEIQARLTKLEEMAMTLDEANDVMKKVITGDSKRAENQRSEILDLFRHGIGNDGETGYDLYNGLTEWLGHHRSYRNTATRGAEENRFLAENDGANQNIRSRFLATVGV